MVVGVDVVVVVVAADVVVADVVVAAEVVAVVVVLSEDLVGLPHSGQAVHVISVSQKYSGD